MQINPALKQPYLENHAKTNIDELLNGSPVNAQDQLAYAHFLMMGKMLSVFTIVSSTKTLCSLAVLQAGFNSADETAMAGSIVGAGGLVLGATGIAQGVSKFEEAKGIAEATQIRNNNLKLLDEESKAKDLNKDITVKVEAIDEPCTSSVNDDIVSEIEEDALCDAEEALSAKQNKMQDQAKDLKQENISTRNRMFGDVEKNKKIKLVNKHYEVNIELKKAKAAKLQAIGNPGQAAYYLAQGLSEHQKAKSQKEGLIQQVQQDNQNQQGNTADGVKKEIDEIAKFDPFQRNSSSLR